MGSAGGKPEVNDRIQDTEQGLRLHLKKTSLGVFLEPSRGDKGLHGGFILLGCCGLLIRLEDASQAAPTMLLLGLRAAPTTHQCRLGQQERKMW